MEVVLGFCLSPKPVFQVGLGTNKYFLSSWSGVFRANASSIPSNFGLDESQNGMRELSTGYISPIISPSAWRIFQELTVVAVEFPE